MDEFEKSYNRSLRFLSFRPRSEKEIIEYLKKKKTSPQVIEKVITKLRDIHLINDEEFAKWWIEQRTGTKPRGIRVIKMELKQKGISDEITETQWAQFTTESEEDLAKRALARKLKAWGKLSEEKFREKSLAFLIRRGFDFETARAAIDELLEKEV